MTRKNALITGVNGQDGIFLSDFLIQEDYLVVGIGNQALPSSFLNREVIYFQCDIRNTDKVISICNQFEISNFYNLAAISSVSQSFDEPTLTEEVNFRAPARILDEFCKNPLIAKERKFFQASSSEMFGLTAIEPQNELVLFNPISPYAKWKTEMHQFCQAKQDGGYFVTSAIMYNHESHFRPETFLSKKVTKTVALIALGKAKELMLGNPHAERDWGFAGDHISAARMIMERDKPDSYVISTGICHSVMNMVEIAFSAVGMSDSFVNYVKFDDSLLRPREVNRLVGDSSKAKLELGWSPKMTFEQLIQSMVTYEISILKS